MQVDLKKATLEEFLEHKTLYYDKIDFTIVKSILSPNKRMAWKQRILKLKKHNPFTALAEGLCFLLLT